MRASLCLPVVLLAACASPDPTALRLRLVHDPELQSEKQILAAVETLELVLDASGGFTGVSSPGQRVGELVATNSDDDAPLELVLGQSLRGRAALPLLRLLPGSNANRSFQITARGTAGGQLAAFGGLSAVRFAPGQALDVLVPFNLRAGFLPPRVLFTLPHDGETKAPATLSQIYLEFSKLVTHESAKAGLKLVYQGKGGDQPVPGGWTLGTNQLADLGLPAERTTATFQTGDGCALSPGTYRLEASAAIVDARGAALDQRADNDVADGYVGRFTIPGAPEAAPCAKPASKCVGDEDCNDKAADAGTQQWVCDKGSGKCVLASASCPALPCPKGYVCQPAAAPGAGSKCVQDCRVLGTCPGVQDYCEASSGLCLPCDPKVMSAKCGGVAEDVTCVFDGSPLEQKCSSTKGSCSGFGSCTVSIVGKAGEVVSWTASCASAAVQTTIDGQSKKALFKCAAAGPVQESVKCVFSGASATTAAQECYSDLGHGCKGVGSCMVKVSGTMGQKLTWKSSCGGYAYTTLDGKDESATFTCK
jgi:hypothetical protein